MTINHINLVVKDVASASKFFETFFKFTTLAIKGDNVIAILENDKGFSLVLSADKKEVIEYPKDFHIGFMFESPDQVDELYEFLVSGGVLLGRQPGKIRDSYAFYFRFDNIFIEVGCTIPKTAENQLHAV